MTLNELKYKSTKVTDNTIDQEIIVEMAIEFSIWELEKVKNKIGSLSSTAWQVLKDKIQELKSFIK